MLERWRRAVIPAGLALATAWVGAAVVVEVVGSRPAPARSYDAIVVLGCKVAATGRASNVLARRAREGARLFLDGRAPMLIMTGGVGTFPPSEARAAAAVAIADGVPESAIVLEERSTSTDENARFARALAPDAQRVLIVTDGFHAIRARRFFLRYFAEVDAAPVTAGPFVRAKGALREVPLLFVQLLSVR